MLRFLVDVNLGEGHYSIQYKTFVSREFLSMLLAYLSTSDAEAETPVLWPPQGKSWLIGEDSDAGRDWGQEEKGTTKDEMAGWHHWLDGCESEWTPGVGDGQGGLACCNSWGRKESDMTERLNWTVPESRYSPIMTLWQVFTYGRMSAQLSLILFFKLFWLFYALHGITFWDFQLNSEVKLV